jgi:hypothetical protein
MKPSRSDTALKNARNLYSTEIEPAAEGKFIQILHF